MIYYYYYYHQSAKHFDAKQYNNITILKPCGLHQPQWPHTLAVHVYRGVYHSHDVFTSGGMSQEVTYSTSLSEMLQTKTG